MIKEIQGDIVAFCETFHLNNTGGKCMFVMHQANCFNTVSNAKGVAKVLADYCPALGEVDARTQRGDANKLGGFTFAAKYDDVYLCNAYGQYRYGNGKRTGKVYTDYDSLKRSLISIRDAAKAKTDKPFFVMPKYIGAGLANGDWQKIYNEILVPVFENDGCELMLVYL